MIETESLAKNSETLRRSTILLYKLMMAKFSVFLGPNGAGKTTTVTMLCCLISKTIGNATVGGNQIGNKEDSLKIRKIIGTSP